MTEPPENKVSLEPMLYILFIQKTKHSIIYANYLKAEKLTAFKLMVE